jgi:hypothetical protein
VSWRNPNESGSVHSVYSYRHNEQIVVHGSDFWSRWHRMSVDAHWLLGIYSPWVKWDHAFHLAADRERLVDDFRD